MTDLATTWPLTSDGLGAVTFTANDWRTIVTALFTEGILGTGSFAVTQDSGGASMNLDIAAGVGVLQGDDAANQGRYLLREDTAQLEAVTIGTADPSNPRHDLVGIQLYDPSEGGAAGRVSTFEVVAGTAAASPSDPATPDSFMVLARVVVPAAAVSITNSDIDDLRTHSLLSHIGMLTGLVDTAHLADDAVTFDKIADAVYSVVGSAGDTLARRGSLGQVSVGDQTDNSHATRKDYVDGSGGSLAGGNIRYRKHGIMVSVWCTASNQGGTLPAGFRPPTVVRLVALDDGASGFVGQIGTDGVIAVGGTNKTYSVTFSTV